VGEETHINTIRQFLGDSGIKFKIEKIGIGDTSYERFTLKEISRYITGFDRFLYIHSKGVSNRHANQDNTYWWRSWMEYNLIFRHEECLKALDKVNIVGVGYTTKQIGPHFSGNFWWTKGSYFNTLPRNPDGTLNIGNASAAPENYIFKGADPSHLDIDEGRYANRDTDIWTAKPGIRVANHSHPKKGGRRRTR